MSNEENDQHGPAYYRPSRQGLKTIVFYVQPEISDELRVLAIRQKTSLQTLMVNAAAEYLVNHGDPAEIEKSLATRPSKILSEILTKINERDSALKPGIEPASAAPEKSPSANPADGIRDSNPRPDGDPDPEPNK